MLTPPPGWQVWANSRRGEGDRKPLCAGSWSRRTKRDLVTKQQAQDSWLPHWVTLSLHPIALVCKWWIITAEWLALWCCYKDIFILKWCCLPSTGGSQVCSWLCTSLSRSPTSPVWSACHIHNRVSGFWVSNSKAFTLHSSLYNGMLKRSMMGGTYRVLLKPFRDSLMATQDLLCAIHVQRVSHYCWLSDSRGSALFHQA